MGGPLQYIRYIAGCEQQYIVYCQTVIVHSSTSISSFVEYQNTNRIISIV